MPGTCPSARLEWVIFKLVRMPFTMPDNATHMAETLLVGEIARVSLLHASRRADPALDRALSRIALWQARRLRNTYADLALDPRYTDAIAFFETDLYGGRDFAQRDADVARVIPVMVRMLPARVIATIAQAMELNALSQELDGYLLGRLPRPDGIFTVAEYCRAFRAMGRQELRVRQVQLIGEIGAALDVFVRKPLIHTALRMMRQPARIAGLGALQHFLERGFEAFQRMRGADVFLATIVGRETEFIDRIFAGEPEPFADPLALAPDG